MHDFFSTVEFTMTKASETEISLGHNDEWVPSFLYGTAWKEEDTERCVKEALRMGFRGLDTANQRKHYNEAGAGGALRSVFSEGTIRREDLFLQTKFTFVAGQDHRIPYDLKSSKATQVRQSFAASLKHLGVESLDSYVLHAPTSPLGMTKEDREAWAAMEDLQREGYTRFLGVSNVTLNHLRSFCEEMQISPQFVQNRCLARNKWDREIRAYCREKKIIYQGFSLLTGNSVIFRRPEFEEVVRRTGLTEAQVVFRFALQLGILPLTGTTNTQHMAEDLESLNLELRTEDVEALENLVV